MKSDNVFVEKTDLLENMLEDVEPNFKYANKTNANLLFTVSKSSNNSMRERSKSTQASKSCDSRAMRKDLSKGLDTDEFKSMANQYIYKEKQKSDRKFENLMNSFEESLKTIRDANKTLAEHDLSNHHKCQQQFDDWNNRIHGTIQQQIVQKVTALDPKVLHKTKYDDYSKFLDITNKKPNIFRDTIIESEYDPLEPNRRAIKVKIDPFKRDPTIIDQQKMYEEAAMLNPNLKRPKMNAHVGKTTLPVELWADNKIASTSFGFQPSKDDGNVTTKEKKSMMIKSNIIFDHFNYPKGKEALDREMPRGKRSIAVKNTLVLD